MSAHSEFVRKLKPIVERQMQARERELQFQALALVDDHTRETVMQRLDAEHARRTERLLWELGQPPLDSLKF